jgi:hypothetical protein
MQLSDTSPQPIEQGSRWHFPVLAAIFLVTFALQGMSPVTTSTDSAWTFHVAASLLREHNFNLDEYSPIINLQLDYRMRVIDGHIYSYYPVATPLLVSPVVWLANILYPLSHPTDFYTYVAQHAPDERTARLEKLIASGIVALSAAVMYLIARRQLRIVGALAIALVFGFATSMWSTASRALWQHGPSVLFLALALYLALIASGRGWFLFLIGCILGFAYLIRPTNSLSVSFFGLYFLINHRRHIWAYVLGLATILVPYIVSNWLTYQNPFPPYSYQLFERLATPAKVGEALVGTLFSPSRGLFIFTPLFLFAGYGLYLTARKGLLSLRSLDIYLAAIVVLHWIVTCTFEDWGGAWSIGPRYFVDVIPFLTYFLIPIVTAWAASGPALKSAFVVAILFSMLVQLHCSTSIDPWMWNGKPEALVQAPQRKWDWGDMQFLRGFCTQNPLEGRAPACWFQISG